ncbi:hypothetical protein [Arcobacter aquimarinus]|uniref:hypothetical protein n=1 Tax=Arcobacter aquimarinus TaxID=1315211 RepID=UPI003BAE52AC
MAKIGNILENTLEDFNDELITGVTYMLGEKSMKPLENALITGDDSIIDEALSSALMSFKFQVMNSVIVTVSQYATAKLVLSTTALVTFVKTGSLTKKLRNLSKGLENVPLVGRVGSRVLRFGVDAIVGDQNERIAIAKMSNDSLNNLTTVISRERQTQTMIQAERMRNLNKQVTNSQNIVSEKFEQKRALFNSKLKSGSWEFNNYDKKLYQDVTGYNFATNPQIFNQAFVDKLNSVADVAKDVEGNIVNQAQAFIDFITTLGYSKVK